MRSRPCEKPKASYRKGLWSPEEDQKLKSYILQHGHGCWSSIPSRAGLQRNGKSCRLRWINYLRPGLKRGVFTAEEEMTVMSLHSKLGNKWSQIAIHLPGRTDNEIKNYWNSYLKKKVTGPSSPNPNSPTKELKCAIAQDPSNSNSASTCSIDTPRNVGQGGFRSSFPKVLFAEWLSSEELGSEAFDDCNLFEDQMQSLNMLISDADTSFDYMY